MKMTKVDLDKLDELYYSDAPLCGQFWKDISLAYPALAARIRELEAEIKMLTEAMDI